MKKLSLIKKLFHWMEKHLHQEINFSEDELAEFFANSFVIKTNGRIIQATPATYREYLYKLKSTLNWVRYDIEELFEVKNIVVAEFIIHLDFNKKNHLVLRVISIFKLNKRNQITEWKEVFADENQQKFSYDPN